MPFYDYKCPNCGISSEFFHPINDKFVKICGECMLNGKNSLMEKQISTPASLHFKGSGFYKTDYKDRSSDVL